MFELVLYTMISGFKTYIQSYTFGDRPIQLTVPDFAGIQERYTSLNKENNATVFPFWSKVWPAAEGLCKYLARHPNYIKDKSVLELAAGLGLPSVFASLYARQV